MLLGAYNTPGKVLGLDNPALNKTDKKTLSSCDILVGVSINEI